MEEAPEPKRSPSPRPAGQKVHCASDRSEAPWSSCVFQDNGTSAQRSSVFYKLETMFFWARWWWEDTFGFFFVLMRESEEVGGEQCASKYWLELAIFWWQREAGSSSFANLTIRWCCYLDGIFSGGLFLSCLSWIPPIRLLSLAGKGHQTQGYQVCLTWPTVLKNKAARNNSRCLLVHGAGLF